MNDSKSHSEQSLEYRKFEAGLKQILSVSKEELDRRIQADKDEQANQKPMPSK